MTLELWLGLEWFKRADEMQAEDRWSNERLGEGLITGLYNPGTFGYFGPPQAGGSRNGFFGDPLCGSPEVGGLAENVIWDPAGAQDIMLMVCPTAPTQQVSVVVPCLCNVPSFLRTNS